VILGHFAPGGEHEVVHHRLAAGFEVGLQLIVRLQILGRDELAVLADHEVG
jgi:hypothetical protein